jgi:hypothetical protein
MGIDTDRTVKLCRACHAPSIDAPPPKFPEHLSAENDPQ